MRLLALKEVDSPLGLWRPTPQCNSFLKSRLTPPLLLPSAALRVVVACRLKLLRTLTHNLTTRSYYLRKTCLRADPPTDHPAITKV